MAILGYLKKHDGEWKNKNEIATFYSGHGMQRGRLDEVLEECVERSLIEKQEAKNPQAKWEYKITQDGKLVLQKYRVILKDPTMRYMAGVKTENFDEVA